MRKLIGICVSLLLSPNAFAGQISALGSGATKNLMNQVATEFTNSTGHTMNLTLASGPAQVRDRIHGGEKFDIAISNTEFINELAVFGDVLPDTQACVAQTSLAVGVKKGAPKPSLTTGKEFKAAMLAATSVAYATEGTSGPHLLQLFLGLGIDKEMQPKLRPMTAPEAVKAVSNGEVEMAVILAASIVPAPGLDFAGTLPPEYDYTVTFDMAVTSSSTVAAAQDFVKFMTDGHADKILNVNGMATCH